VSVMEGQGVEMKEGREGGLVVRFEDHLPLF
jgi:hypothetical protein